MDEGLEHLTASGSPGAQAEPAESLNRGAEGSGSLVVAAPSPLAGAQAEQVGSLNRGGEGSGRRLVAAAVALLAAAQAEQAVWLNQGVEPEAQPTQIALRRDFRVCRARGG